MNERISNPPDASALMTTARSFGSYDLAGALADLIDNSISAKSRNIGITCSLEGDGDCEIRIRDDGTGMTRDELKKAMRPASSNPKNERSPDDLGRFGWGMKSASFSQCKVLTVVSFVKGLANGARWDLDNIDDWRMDMFDHDQAVQLLKEPFQEQSGTELVWSHCDRLSESNSLKGTQFNALIAKARRRLALIFHRYLSGEGAAGGPLKISINGTELDSIDPFVRNNLATTPFDKETIRLSDRGNRYSVTMQAFTLPHHSKLSQAEYEEFGGEEGYLRNQGFYVYRNKRLIIWGTWFGLAKHGELSKLVRIRVDIPNALDEMWKITIDKSGAQLPTALKKRMKKLIDAFRDSSTKVFRSKGGKIDSNKNNSVWVKTVRHQMIRYGINRRHPLINSIRNSLPIEIRKGLNALLNMVETEIPIESINLEVNSKPQAVYQGSTSPEEFRDFVRTTVPLMAAQYESFEILSRDLKTTEPYASNWSIVEEVLKEMVANA